MNIENPIAHLAEQKEIRIYEYCAEDSSLATEISLGKKVRLNDLKDSLSIRGYKPIHFTRLKRLQVLVDGISFHVNESGMINANSIASVESFYDVMTKVAEDISHCIDLETEAT
ncbi:hypothetical protein QXB71_003408 [Vibrio cholerae]|nr:hypothetical protein [Vibrio cholerae]EJL6761955.1 hypothetical protein [Vibrio cholerae]ELO1828158.1 hypothetical protein [Vibrio cholerae]